MKRDKFRGWKGLLAGAAGGLIASFAMGRFSALFMSGSNSEPGKEDSTVLAASAISRALFHHELAPDQKNIAGPAVHYLFGATMGATYGVVAEYWAAARTGWGLPFGAAVLLGAHAIAVPALGLSGPITRNAPAAEAVESAAHLIYGAVVEAVRRSLRTPKRRSDFLRSGH
jgi:putative membrane protein